MSNLLARIKADSIAARKAKNTVIAGVLTTLLGEIVTKEKTFNPARPITEDEIVAIVQKFLKSNAESLALVARIPADRRDAEHAKMLAEKVALEVYLPKQMSAEDIAAFARSEAEIGNNTMGGIMAALKKTRPGEYDGRTASAVIKSILG